MSEVTPAVRRYVSELRELLWPDYSKVDHELEAELERRGVIGLRIVSIVAIALPLFGVLLLSLLDGEYGRGLLGLAWIEEASLVAVGTAGLAASRTEWGARHSRGLAVVVGTLVGAFAVLDMVASGGYGSSVYSALVVVMLVMVAAVPLRPLALLGFGMGLAVMFAASALLDASFAWPPPVTWLERLVMLVMVALLGGGLGALISHLHVQEHRSRAELAESLAMLRRTQANLIASKRAASQGKLAAALSHEINSPLGVAVTSSQLIERYLADLSGKCGDPQAVSRLVAEAKTAAGTSREALGRIHDLLTRFERFSHVDAAEQHPVDVNELIDDTVAVLSGGWSEGVQVVRDYEELPSFTGYPARLTEVFSNLLSNAAEAMDGTGEIRITTRYARGYIWIQIADSGHGIDMDELGSIFDPGFRVKDGRVRTGWGLFISRQIIHDHNGEFHINSERERGTEVEICLPVGRPEPD